MDSHHDLRASKTRMLLYTNGEWTPADELHVDLPVQSRPHLLCKRAMVRSEGFAPSTTGCKPGVILFHQLRVFKKWRPRQESHLHSDLRRVVCDLLHYEDVEDLAGIAPATR